jgi:hypothetical protein
LKEAIRKCRNHLQSSNEAVAMAIDSATQSKRNDRQARARFGECSSIRPAGRVDAPQEVEMRATRASRLRKNEVLKQIQIERSEPGGVGAPKTRVFLGRVAKAVSWIGVLGVVLTPVRATRAENAPRGKIDIGRADGGDIGVALKADVDCTLLPHPGKVACVVRLRPVGGTLHFSDVIVLSAPAFARPLRDRVAIRDAKPSDDGGADLPLALAATGDGDGELYVMGRATVCGERGCRPVQAEASARVLVGASSSAR